jgi:hypothetical protein
VFTRALHWSLSRGRSIQSISSHPISLRSILVLYTHLRLGLSSSLFPSGFSTNILITQFSPTSCHFIFLWSKYSQTPSVYVPPLMSVTKFHTHNEPYPNNLLTFQCGVRRRRPSRKP